MIRRNASRARLKSRSPGGHMEIKERYYRRIPQLVRRDRTNTGTSHLDPNLTDKLHAYALLESVPSVSPGHPSLIPTADGAFTRLLLTIPSYAVEDPTVSAAYESLLSKLPVGVHLVVLAQQSCQDSVNKWLALLDQCSSPWFISVLVLFSESQTEETSMPS